MKREKWIDVAKGICILLMIFGHIDIEASQINRWFYSFHMIVFFLLSGYTLKIKGFNREYIGKKFKHLMLPYFWTCFFILIMDCINSVIWRKDASMNTITFIIGKDIMRSFFGSGYITNFAEIELGTRIGIIWILPALFFSNIIVQGILNYVSNKKRQIASVLCIAMVAVITKDFIWFPFSIQSGMVASLFVLLGYYMKVDYILENLTRKEYIICSIIYLFGTFFNFWNVGLVYARMSDYILSTIVGLSGSILIFYISKKISNISILNYIGKNSLFYLCVHLFELETMGIVYDKIISKFGLSYREKFIYLFIIKIIAITLVVVGINVLTKYIVNKSQSKVIQSGKKRNLEIDILRGILIISMIFGHFGMNSRLRKIIYSVHMPAFILVSGYFYKKRSIKDQFIRDVKGLLIPYIIYCIGFFITDYQGTGIQAEIIRFILGMSFPKKILVDYGRLGPIYFLLLLFVTKNIYNMIQLYAREKQCHVIIAMLSVIGYVLGREGYWLPWSFDIALYSLIIYHIGYLLRQHNVLEKIKVMPYLYFPIASIWTYMIYTGSIELAIRNYNSYTIGLVGTVAGFFVLYLLVSYIATSNIPVIIKNGLITIGQCTNIILVVHSLFKARLGEMVSKWFDLSYIYGVILLIIIQILISLIIQYCFNFIKKKQLR